MGETETYQFHDSGTCGRAPEPQNHLFLFLLPQNTFLIYYKTQLIFAHNILRDLKISKIEHFETSLEKNTVTDTS